MSCCRNNGYAGWRVGFLLSVMVMCYLSDECVGFGMFRGGSLGASLEVVFIFGYFSILVDMVCASWWVRCWFDGRGGSFTSGRGGGLLRLPMMVGGGKSRSLCPAWCGPIGGSGEWRVPLRWRFVISASRRCGSRVSPISATGGSQVSLGMLLLHRLVSRLECRRRG